MPYTLVSRRGLDVHVKVLAEWLFSEEVRQLLRAGGLLLQGQSPTLTYPHM